MCKLQAVYEKLLEIRPTRLWNSHDDSNGLYRCLFTMSLRSSHTTTVRIIHVLKFRHVSDEERCPDTASLARNTDGQLRSRVNAPHHLCSTFCGFEGGIDPDPCFLQASHARLQFRLVLSGHTHPVSSSICYLGSSRSTRPFDAWQPAPDAFRNGSGRRVVAPLRWTRIQGGPHLIQRLH